MGRAVVAAIRRMVFALAAMPVPTYTVASEAAGMGRRQAVRQRILIPSYGGSNPPAPAMHSSHWRRRFRSGPMVRRSRGFTTSFWSHRGSSKLQAAYCRSITTSVSGRRFPISELPCVSGSRHRPIRTCGYETKADAEGGKKHIRRLLAMMRGRHSEPEGRFGFVGGSWVSARHRINGLRDRLRVRPEDGS